MFTNPNNNNNNPFQQLNSQNNNINDLSSTPKFNTDTNNNNNTNIINSNYIFSINQPINTNFNSISNINQNNLSFSLNNNQNNSNPFIYTTQNQNNQNINLSIENNIPQSSLFSQKYIDNENDWSQKFTTQSKEIIDRQKQARFNHNFAHKLKIFKLNKTNTKNNINEPNNKNLLNFSDNVFINDYVKKIFDIYNNKEKEPYEYKIYVEENGVYNFSFCPFCKYPAVYYLGRVFCINGCFFTYVPINIFNENFTLSNFIEQYRNYSSLHINCHTDLCTIFSDDNSKGAYFICPKCEKEFLQDYLNN